MNIEIIAQWAWNSPRLELCFINAVRWLGRCVCEVDGQKLFLQTVTDLQWNLAHLIPMNCRLG